MKKFANDMNYMVDQELDGLVYLYRNTLRRLPDSYVVVRKDSPVLDKVALVSGGGSGHEPMHGGFVGRGLLDAAVAGEIFTAPPPDQIYSAIKEVNGERGVLLIINNYAGDVMNFKLAEDLARDAGIRISHVINNDDVSIELKERRRGVAGTILVEKVAGAMAERGAELDEVKRVASKVIENMRSMGAALDSCTLPQSGKPLFTLGEDEIELGIGVHGEKGVERTRLKTADEIAEILFTRISKDLGLRTGEDEVVLMVNGMGGTPLMELLIVARKAVRLLDESGIKIFRSFAGNFVTSLDMPGLSMTLLRVDDEMKKMLLAPEFTPSFPKML